MFVPVDCAASEITPTSLLHVVMVITSSHFFDTRGNQRHQDTAERKKVFRERQVFVLCLSQRWLCVYGNIYSCTAGKLYLQVSTAPKLSVGNSAEARL